jgi:hypothetical protein
MQKRIKDRKKEQIMFEMKKGRESDQSLDLHFLLPLQASSDPCSSLDLFSLSFL